MIQILNQVFEIQHKINQLNITDKFSRNMTRLISICEENGYTMQDPLGEKYNESRTDIEANISGNLTNNMIISQVIKPIIYQIGNEGEKTLVQKGIVIVEAK
jgi:hypothetical protein